VRQRRHVPARVGLAGLEGHVDLPCGAQQGRRAQEEAQHQLPVLLHPTKQGQEAPNEPTKEPPF